MLERRNILDIVEKLIGEIKPYENNPRKNDDAVDVVAKSIETFGFKVPLVVDADNVIVCGHTRYKAAKKLGLKKVPCVVADDLTPEQIKAFRLADNKVSEYSNWDYRLLDVELSSLACDMTEFGFYDSELDFESVVKDLTEENPQAPRQNLSTCPKCGYTAGAALFKGRGKR